MSEYRRYFVPGGTYFFTLVTAGRKPFLCEPRARRCLREAFELCKRRWPFTIIAVVLLPEHLHTIWSLPHDDADYSRRWAFLKRTFTLQWLATGAPEGNVTPGWQRQRRRGVWQPRFWEHSIGDEVDLERHVEYIVYNPVKHGLVRCPRDWPYSSFHRLVRLGDFDRDWGCSEGLTRPMDFSDIASTAFE